MPPLCSDGTEGCCSGMQSSACPPSEHPPALTRMPGLPIPPLPCRSIEQQGGEEMVVVAEPKAKVVKGERHILS